MNREALNPSQHFHSSVTASDDFYVVTIDN